jgi:hypothetical protein
LASPQLLFRQDRGLSINAQVASGANPTGQIFAVPQYHGPHGPLQIAWDTRFTGTALTTVNVRLEGTNDDNPQGGGTVWAELMYRKNKIPFLTIDHESMRPQSKLLRSSKLGRLFN